MGFNKRYIDKDCIICNSNIRELLNTNSIICLDTWSSNFIGGLNHKESSIRKKIIENNYLKSSIEYSESELNSLSSMSERLIDLLNNPDWVDIVSVTRKMNISFDETERGRFDIMKDKCIKILINHFD